jgi:hypothetical protein
MGGATYKVEKLHGKPIVDGNDVRRLRIGADPNRSKLRGDAMFPTMVRIPDWVPAEERANPNAKYYLYCASHHATSIHMAWSDRVDSPDWTFFNAGKFDDPRFPGRGVFDLKLGNTTETIDVVDGIVLTGHVSSPEVIVDDENQRFIMVVHGKSNESQRSFVATSKNGLNFNRPAVGGDEGHGLKHVKFGDRNYLRVFQYNGEWYGFGQRGYFLKPADPNYLWDAPEGWDSSNPLWVAAETSPIEDDLAEAGLGGPHLPNGGLGMRHGSVRVMEDGKTLEAFYSRKWEVPEYIVRSTVDLSASEWNAWQTSYPPEDMVRAVEDWEGDVVHDSYVYEDDGQVYLFYTCREEDAIAVAKLTPQ